MQYRHYGNTQKQVSLLGMGTSRLSGNEAQFSVNVDLVHRALALGINYFDTAPTYASGTSEKILGAAFQEHRTRDFMVASKSMLSMDPTADNVLRRIESSLKTLHVDKIDFFHMWSVLTLEQYEKIIAPGGPYEGALRAREQGLIERHAGIQRTELPASVRGAVSCQLQGNGGCRHESPCRGANSPKSRVLSASPERWRNRSGWSYSVCRLPSGGQYYSDRG